MNQDPIPRKDIDLNNWVIPFAAYIATNGTTMSIKAAIMLALANAVAVWKTAYAGVANPATATSIAVSLKKEARVELEAVLRPLLRQIQANPDTTDDMRTAMNIHITTGTHTRAAVPTTAPQLTVVNGQHQSHTIVICDVNTPGSTVKPAGVKGCNVYFKVGGPAPLDISEMALHGVASTSPHAAQFAGAQAGKAVYYCGCWVNTHDETGPMSDLVSATIIG